MRRRGIAVAAALAGALGASVLVAGLPFVDEAPAARAATPSSAGQTLVCPGAALAVGAAGHSATTITAVGTVSRTVDRTAGQKAEQRRLKHKKVDGTSAQAPRTYSASAAADGVLAGAQSEVVTTGDATGFTATACRRPANDLWLAAGATTTGRSSVLLLANPTGVAATVTTVVYTGSGRVASATVPTVAVPAHGSRAIALSGLAPGASALGVHVVAVGGAVTAGLEQRTVHGLVSGGIDVATATTAPSTLQTVPGVRILGAAAVTAARTVVDDTDDLTPVARLLVPGDQDADVSVTATSASGGGGTTVTRHVRHGTVVDASLVGLADGDYTVTVRSTRPVVVGVRASTATDPTAAAAAGTAVLDPSTGAASREFDLAWLAAAPALGSTAAVAVAKGPDPHLVLANPTTRPITVRLQGVLDRTVEVAAGTSATVPVSRGLLRLGGADGLHAGVAFGGPAALAGYPVEADPDAAQTVHVSE